MPENYYTSSTSYPAIINALAERTKLYTCSLLYPTEAYAVSGKRFILSNFESGEEIAIRNSIQTFKTSQARFPFTAYNIGEMVEVPERRTLMQRNLKYYDKNFGCYISAQPMQIEITMMTFTVSANDYFRVRTLLHNTNAQLTRLWVPITINGYETTFPIDLKYEIAKFSLAFEFEEFLRVGKIFDIQHTATLFFHNIITDANIDVVEDMELTLLRLSDIDQSQSISQGTLSMPNTPIVSSTDPSDGEISVDRDDSIVINFNVAMDEASVEDYLSTDPFISADYLWNSSGTQLLIDPVDRMSSGTLYTIIITDDAKSGYYDIPLEEDYEFSFTTGND